MARVSRLACDKSSLSRSDLVQALRGFGIYVYSDPTTAHSPSFASYILSDEPLDLEQLQAIATDTAD